MRHGRAADLEGVVEAARVRRIGDEFDETALGACTIERALRAAQHFDALHVKRIEVGRRVRAVGERVARAIRRFVEIGADGRAVAAGIDAAQDKHRMRRIGFRDRQSGHLVHQVFEAADVELIKLFFADRPRSTSARFSPTSLRFSAVTVTVSIELPVAAVCACAMPQAVPAKIVVPSKIAARERIDIFAPK